MCLSHTHKIVAGKGKLLIALLLAGGTLLAVAGETSGFWIICDIIDAGKAADRASKATENMLDRLSKGDQLGADQAKQELKEGIKDAAESAKELIEKTPGTSVNPTPPDLDDLKEGLWEGLKDFIRGLIGGSQSRLTVPPPVEAGAFASQGRIYVASPGGQEVAITPPQSITANVFSIAPSQYDNSRGPLPPEFFTWPPGMYAVGTFSNAVLSPFATFDPNGTSHVFDAQQLAAGLAGEPDLTTMAFPGANFTPNLFTLVPEAKPGGPQVMLLTITSVDTVTGNVSGTYMMGTAVPEPAALVLSIAGAMLLMSWYVRRARLPIV